MWGEQKERGERDRLVQEDASLMNELAAVCPEILFDIMRDSVLS
jgi:hypothetical protein